MGLTSSILSFRWLPYKQELMHAASGEEDCVWGPPNVQRQGSRCWVLLPGGMSSGRDFYITSFARSKAIAEAESWVVFHNPGQGGSKMPACAETHAELLGLTRTDCLAHFLRSLRANFEHIVVVGFSAGGMPTMAMAQQEQPIAD